MGGSFDVLGTLSGAASAWFTVALLFGWFDEKRAARIPRPKMPATAAPTKARKVFIETLKETTKGFYNPLTVLHGAGG
jgi:hypothetical protein